MKPFYFTFGQVHRHKVNEKIFDKDCVACIEAENFSIAREKAFDLFGGFFHMQYSERELTLDILKHFPRGVIKI